MPINPCNDRINSLPEVFDPTTALVEALDSIELMKDAITILQNRQRELSEELVKTKLELTKLADKHSDLLDSFEKQQEANRAAHEFFRENLLLLLPETETRKNRGEILVALLARNGGQMMQKEVAKIMSLTPSMMSKLLKSVARDVGSYKDISDSRSNILFLKNFKGRKILSDSKETILGRDSTT